MKRSKKPTDDSETGVPGKKVRTAPTNTSLLPPCKVCLEPAAGFHYGVNTCEACKGFFRRSLLRKEEYKCLGNGNCNIHAGKRKICPKCRHKKCLAVGMSTGDGRVTIRQHEYPHSCSGDLRLHRPTVTESSTVSQYASNGTAAASQTSLASTTTNGAVGSQTPSDVSHPPITLASSSNSVASDSVTQASGVSSVCTNPLSPNSGKFDLSSPLSVSSLADNMLDSLVEGHGRLDEVTSPLSAVSTSPSTSSSVASPPPMRPSPATATSSPSDGLDDEECKKIVEHLVEAHNRVIHTFKFTPEELLEKQEACAETCELRAKMFGPLKQLSEEEYQDFYQQTGLDVDGRQSFLTSLSQNLEDSIRRFTAFVKAVPGFSQLSLKDQIRLIKDNRCEFGMLSMYRGFNKDLKVVTMFSGRTFCVHEFERFAGKSLAHQRFEAAAAVQKLGLSPDEDILLKSMVIVTCGHDDLDEPEKASDIQWKLTQCLLWLLKQNRPDPHLTFARIINALCQIRTFSSECYEWIKTKPFAHYSQFKDNALLVEWFSNTIKTGRHTLARRTQDILEYKQMAGLASDNMSTPTPAAWTSAFTDCKSLETSTVSQHASNGTAAASTTTNGALGSQKPSAVSHPPITLASSSNSAASDSVIQASVVSSVPTKPLSPLSGKFDLSSPLSILSLADNMLDILVKGHGRLDEVTSPLSAVSASPSTSSSVASPPPMMPSPATATSSPSDALDDEECEKIVEHLVEAHNSVILTFKFTPEELLEKQKACAETCKQVHTEMFGPLKQLSEEEHQDIYQQTGLGVDGQQSFMTSLSQNLEGSMRRFTAFVKAVPGFSQLPLKDQIRLIRDNRCEFGMLSMYHGFNKDLKVVTMFSGRTFCVHEFERFAGKNVAHLHFEAADAVQKLGLSPYEEILLKSMVVVTC
ncbi:hypothetical protein BaRGS_00022994, partial [Batillaria attramentaria]